MKKQRYELSCLFHSYLNEETVNEIINNFETKFKDKNIKIIESKEVGRYDAVNNKKNIKVNLVSVIFEVDNDSIPNIKTYLKGNNQIVRFLIIKENNRIIDKLFDYKKPIEMKKYLFESMRIMSVELTKHSSKYQRILATNIKRDRHLGLISTK